MTSSTKMALAVMAMNTLPLGGLLVFVSQGSRADGEVRSRGGGGEREAPGPMLALVNHVVQLRPAEAGSQRHAIIDFDLELTSEGARAEVILQLPRVRDLVITRLWQLTAAELRRPGGLDDLKEHLRDRLNHMIPGQPVRRVYVVDFLIQ